MTQPSAISDRIIPVLRALIFFWVTASAFPSAAQVSEQDLKAAFLFNFALFTKPAETAARAGQSDTDPSRTDPYRICIHGKHAMASSGKILNMRMIAGRTIVVRNTATADELKQCELVYIGALEPDSVRRAVQAVTGFPIITVSDSKEFPTPGMVFNLVRVDEKIAFQINTQAARNQQLDVSAKLTRLAKDVH